MRGFVGCLIALLLSMSANAADFPAPWVELTSDGGLDVRAVVAPGMPCPEVAADRIHLDSNTRGSADTNYPVHVCIAHSSTSARRITVDGMAVPTLPADIKRIVVIGDTGCRLKGDFIQDCNDPVKWPFARVAHLAAARHPDLIIHVGDYHYREAACPMSRPGCAGSPYGDNWAAWQKDFFDPAGPLLAAAPWVMVRGNHELCGRGAQGWFRLLDPHAYADQCVNTTPPYALRIARLHLLVFDSSDANDWSVDAAQVAVYRAQLQTLLANAPPRAWLLTHRPVWALAQDPGQPGDTVNATEQAAIRGLVPKNLDMVISGHVHQFTSYDFGPRRPAQLVVGSGGDTSDALSQPARPGIPIDGLNIRRVLAIPDYGYFVLQRAKRAWTGTLYGITDQPLAQCWLHERDVTCHSAGR